MMNRRIRIFMATTLLVFSVVVIAQAQGFAQQIRPIPTIAQAPPLNSEVATATIEALRQNAPNAPKSPQVRRTTVEGDYALASWIFGEAGGQTLLVRQEQTWTVVGSGGGAMDQNTLVQYGVPPAIAQTLITRDQAAQQP